MRKSGHIPGLEKSSRVPVLLHGSPVAGPGGPIGAKLIATLTWWEGPGDVLGMKKKPIGRGLMGGCSAPWICCSMGSAVAHSCRADLAGSTAQPVVAH